MMIKKMVLSKEQTVGFLNMLEAGGRKEVKACQGARGRFKDMAIQSLMDYIEGHEGAWDVYIYNDDLYVILYD